MHAGGIHATKSLRLCLLSYTPRACLDYRPCLLGAGAQSRGHSAAAVSDPDGCSESFGNSRQPRCSDFQETPVNGICKAIIIEVSHNQGSCAAVGSIMSKSRCLFRRAAVLTVKRPCINQSQIRDRSCLTKHQITRRRNYGLWLNYLTFAENHDSRS